jgi:hypothetical protein
VGNSGGRSSKTRTVIRTAKTPSENAFNRSVARFACGTVLSPPKIGAGSMTCQTRRLYSPSHPSVSTLLLQKVSNAFRDFAGMGFEGEVASVEEPDNRARVVAPKCFSA